MMRRQYLALLLLTGLVLAGMGSEFAKTGFWPILTFGVAERILFALALTHVWQRTQIQEELIISESLVVLERGWTQPELIHRFQ